MKRQIQDILTVHMIMYSPFMNQLLYVCNRGRGRDNRLQQIPNKKDTHSCYKC